MDETMSTIEEREDAITSSEKSTPAWMQKYSQEWKEVLAMVLEKAYVDPAFFARIIKDFAANNWASSKFAKEAMISFRTGLAVYGRLNTKTPEGTRIDRATGEVVPKLSQFELAMSILRQHPSILVEKYAADVGVIVNEEEAENVKKDGKVPF